MIGINEHLASLASLELPNTKRQSLVDSSVAVIIGLSNNDWIQVQSGDIRVKLSL